MLEPKEVLDIATDLEKKLKDPAALGLVSLKDKVDGISTLQTIKDIKDRFGRMNFLHKQLPELWFIGVWVTSMVVFFFVVSAKKIAIAPASYVMVPFMSFFVLIILSVVIVILTRRSLHNYANKSNRLTLINQNLNILKNICGGFYGSSYRYIYHLENLVFNKVHFDRGLSREVKNDLGKQGSQLQAKVTLLGRATTFFTIFDGKIDELFVAAEKSWENRAAKGEFMTDFQI